MERIVQASSGITIPGGDKPHGDVPGFPGNPSSLSPAQALARAQGLRNSQISIPALSIHNCCITEVQILHA